MFSFPWLKKKEISLASIDINALIENRDNFNRFIYTPLEEALKEIERRRKDPMLSAKIKTVIDSPPAFLEGEKIPAVLFRQIATPNHEIRRFLSLLEPVDEVEPFFGEHRDDKFVTNNQLKHSWGKLYFNINNRIDSLFSTIKIIDMAHADRKPLSEIKTLWGQSLIEFHHELFEHTYRKVSEKNFHNISPWLKEHGGSARNYYVPIMAWFIQNGILFENFSLDDEHELRITRDVCVPAFMELYRITGYKPLIVNLLPTTMEDKKFWLSHPASAEAYVNEKMKSLSHVLP